MIILVVDQHIRLYETSGQKLKIFKDIAAKDVGWSVIDTAFSPDQSYIIYSTWSEYSKYFYIRTI